MSTFIYDSELAQLSSLGFKGKNQCVSLLNRTRGNVEVIAKYLKLKAELNQAKKNGNDIQSIKRAIFDVKKNIPNRGYYEQQEKKVAKKFAKAEKEAQLKTEAEVVQEPLTDPIDVDASPKSAKRAAKELKKQEKKAKRSIERNEKKEAKELAKKLAMIDHLPENINKVFLDGNNMLFVLDILRKKCLNRKMKVAEHLLEEMAREWITKSPELQFCTLIFDDTKTNKMDNKMKVCSARPEYPTSDDALIDWSKKFSDEEKKETAVFTSDRALTLILQENGVQVFKSKAWFKLMRKVVDVEDAKEEDSYDEWSQKWFSQYELNH